MNRFFYTWLVLSVVLGLGLTACGNNDVTEFGSKSSCRLNSGWPCACKNTDYCLDDSRCIYIKGSSAQSGKGFCSPLCAGAKGLYCPDAEYELSNDDDIPAEPTCLLGRKETPERCALVCEENKQCPDGQKCKIPEDGKVSICYPDDSKISKDKEDEEEDGGSGDDTEDEGDNESGYDECQDNEDNDGDDDVDCDDQGCEDHDFCNESDTGEEDTGEEDTGEKPEDCVSAGYECVSFFECFGGTRINDLTCPNNQVCCDFEEEEEEEAPGGGQGGGRP